MSESKTVKIVSYTVQVIAVSEAEAEQKMLRALGTGTSFVWSRTGVRTLIPREAVAGVFCDECGEELPVAGSLRNSEHAPHCSLYITDTEGADHG